MIKILACLESLLETNHALHSFVLSSAATTGPCAQDNRTVFFLDYIDPSPVHLHGL